MNAQDTTNASVDSTLDQVRQHYADIANGAADSCCPPSAGETSGDTPASAKATGPTVSDYSAAIGYSTQDLTAVPEGANLGLGCGNPLAIASLVPGNVVVDLGSGGGFDAFLAARKVGPTGRVIGVDMTPEMLAKARRNAVSAELHGHVEFREGTIDALPVRDASVDVIISNCVINLAPDKPAVLAEAMRTLKPGGRLAISDILVSEPLPASLSEIDGAYAGCLTGAAVADEFLAMLDGAGFSDIQHTKRPAFECLESAGCSDVGLLEAATAKLGADGVAAVAKTVFSYTIEARKPMGAQ